MCIAQNRETKDMIWWFQVISFLQSNISILYEGYWLRSLVAPCVNANAWRKDNYEQGTFSFQYQQKKGEGHPWWCTGYLQSRWSIHQQYLPNLQVQSIKLLVTVRSPSTKCLNATMLFLSRIMFPFGNPSLFRPVLNSMILEWIRKSPFWVTWAYLLESGSNLITAWLPSV